MKKILLGTTGLVGAALLATAASAETPKVTLGGFSDFQAGWVGSDEGATLNTNSDHNGAFRNENVVSVRVDGKTDSGLGYGAVIDLQADMTNNTDNTGTNANRTFTYLEGSWGRVELGGNKSAASTMRVDASTLAVASGGINGAWHYFVNNTGATTTPGTGVFISTAGLQLEHGSINSLGDKTTYNASKVSYYTPRFSGFQAGASYTPNVNGKGQNTTRLDGAAEFSDAWDVGVSYDGQFSGVKVAASATGEWATSDNTAEDIQGWNAGALLGWQGFSVAGSYGDWSKGSVSSTAGAPTATATDGKYWTAGLGYDAGAVGLSATYLGSKLDVAAGDNKFSNIVLGADYKLAPGLTPYAEVSFFDFNAQAAGQDNQGQEVILGTTIAF